MAIFTLVFRFNRRHLPLAAISLASWLFWNDGFIVELKVMLELRFGWLCLRRGYFTHLRALIMHIAVLGICQCGGIVLIPRCRLVPFDLHVIKKDLQPNSNFYWMLIYKYCLPLQPVDFIRAVEQLVILAFLSVINGVRADFSPWVPFFISIEITIGVYGSFTRCVTIERPNTFLCPRLISRRALIAIFIWTQWHLNNQTKHRRTAHSPTAYLWTCCRTCTQAFLES